MLQRLPLSLGVRSESKFLCHKLQADMFLLSSFYALGPSATPHTQFSFLCAKEGTPPHSMILSNRKFLYTSAIQFSLTSPLPWDFFSLLAPPLA